MFEYIPLLHHLEALYQMPRNIERFERYVRSFLNESGEDVDIPPLVVANPMAKEHALGYVRGLLEMGAEEIAKAATQEAESRLPKADLKVSLMVLDDAKGGWTNRYTTVSGLWSLEQRALERWKRSAWVTVGCWTSEVPTVQHIRQQTLTSLYQATWAMTKPLPKTLREILVYEGQALAFAGVEQWLDGEELRYTRAVLEPHLESTQHPVLIVALQGDAAAKSLGYPALGLSDRAGLGLALENTRK